MKFLRVIIQMKAIEQYFPLVLFVFQYFAKWNSKFFFPVWTWVFLEVKERGTRCWYLLVLIGSDVSAEALASNGVGTFNGEAGTKPKLKQKKQGYSTLHSGQMQKPTSHSVVSVLKICISSKRLRSEVRKKSFARNTVTKQSTRR